MANPAELLHTTLRSWISVKGHVDPAAQRIAVSHLDAIEELLNQMDAAEIDTEPYRKHFDRWAKLTLHHPYGWRNGGDATPALDQLQSLAAWFKALVPTVTDGGLDTLRKYAEESLQVLADDDSIDDLVKQHVEQVAAHLIWCVDHYREVGDFSLREAADRLIAAMVTTAARSRHKERWRQWMNTFTYPFTVNVISAIPAQAVVQLALGG